MHTPDIDELRRALGGPEATTTIAAFCARGPDVVAELFAALLEPFTGPADRDGRAVFEDEALCLHSLATRHPDEFLAQLDARPGLAGRASVLVALAQVPGPDAEQRLLAALTHRRSSIRDVALTGLLARDCAAVLPHLPRLLRDRDSTVAFTALDGLRRWGRGEHLSALCSYLVTAPPGGLEFGRDAIEAICAREGLPLPAEHPGPRLERVRRDGVTSDVRVIVASRVATGELLAHVDAAPLRSPCAGVVSAIDHTPAHLTITIRRT